MQMQTAVTAHTGTGTGTGQSPHRCRVAITCKRQAGSSAMTVTNVPVVLLPYLSLKRRRIAVVLLYLVYDSAQTVKAHYSCNKGIVDTAVMDMTTRTCTQMLSVVSTTCTSTELSTNWQL